MKASLKLRENQDPLLKSKIPLKILGIPFRSSLEASTNYKELCLSFSTAFEYGPSLKLNYRPNDPCRPFGFVFKTGIGHFGSPVRAPISVSAEFNMIGNSSPRFFLYLEPRIGDFSNKQTIVHDMSLSSQRPLRIIPHDSDIKSDAILANSDEEQEKMSWSGMLSSRLQAAKSLVDCGEIHARTAVPVRDMAVVNLRWEVRFLATSAVDGKHDDWSNRIPYLVLNKIGIEHVEGRNEPGRECGSREIESGSDVVEACLGVKKQLELLRYENEMLKKDFDKLKEEIGDWAVQRQSKNVIM